jgi:hypothetical protein
MQRATGGRTLPKGQNETIDLVGLCSQTSGQFLAIGDQPALFVGAQPCHHALL